MKATFNTQGLVPCCLATIFLLLFFNLMPIQSFSSEPINIGAIFSETGIAAPHNKPLLDMTRFAVDVINSEGGIAGRKLHLTIYDNKSTPIGSAQAAHQAVKDGMTAVLGAHWSSHSLGMAPILQAAGVIMITPASTNPEVTRIGDCIFRICFLDSVQGDAMARFTRTRLKAEKAVVLVNIDEKYSITLARYFEDAFHDLGGTLMAELSYRRDATDFTEILTEISRNQPDVIYLPGYTRDSGLIIKQARKLGIEGTFLGGDAWDEIELQTGDAINGSYQTAPWHPGVTFPESERLQKLYIDRFHKTIDNISSPLAYDAVQVLAEAIRRAGSTDQKAIKHELATMKNFQGATGLINFDDHGDPINKNIIVLRYSNKARFYVTGITPQ